MIWVLLWELKMRRCDFEINLKMQNIEVKERDKLWNVIKTFIKERAIENSLELEEDCGGYCSKKIITKGGESWEERWKK